MSELERLWVGPLDDPDRYEIGPPIEAGTEGILYRGRLVTPTSGLSLTVAVKALQPSYAERLDQWAARWRDQVELLRSLQIPGLVTVREGFVGPLPHRQGDRSSKGRNLYLVMNWVDGQPLDEWIANHPGTNPKDALKVLLPVAVALDMMHSGQLTEGVPVVHRDVKPANILVGDTGATLVDFGLTKGLSEGRMVGRAGTPGYIAPEVEAGGAYTPAADRYGFGATVYFLLTGGHPSADASQAELRIGLQATVGGTHPELVDRVLTMLDADPARRPPALANWIAQLRQSSLGDEFDLERLTPVALGLPGGQPALQPGPVARPAAGRNKTRRLVAVAIAAVICVAIAATAFASQGTDKATGAITTTTATTARTSTAQTSPHPATTSKTATTNAPPVAMTCPGADARCGPFHWTPAPNPKPLIVTAGIASPNPIAGQPVTFNVQIVDPNGSSALTVVREYYGDITEQTGLAATGPCIPPYGAWPLPPPGPQQQVEPQKTHIFPAGTFKVHFSAASGAADPTWCFIDPYASQGDSNVLTVNVAAAPPPITTGPVPNTSGTTPVTAVATTTNTTTPHAGTVGSG